MAYTPHQKKMIQLALGLSGKDSPKVRRALLEAMAVESNFRHLGYGDRDSVGVLQQRPSQGWGPATETPAQDINQFLSRARALGAFQGTAGQLAQAVQHSAFPARYDQRLRQANQLLGGGAVATPPMGSPPPERGLSTAFSLSGLRQAMDSGPLALLSALRASRPQSDSGLSSPSLMPSQPTTGAPGGSGVPEELFYDPLGSYDSGHFGGPIGGHGTHVHVSETNPAAMLRDIQLAQRMGLRVSENPWVGAVGSGHTHKGAGSFHYRSEPFQGRKMGQGLDVSGSPASMAAYYKALAPKRAKR